jgi:hypothetical protein
MVEIKKLNLEGISETVERFAAEINIKFSEGRNN